MDWKVIRRKCGSKWPMWIVQLILKLFVNSVPPSSGIPNHSHIGVYQGRLKLLKNKVTFTNGCKGIPYYLASPWRKPRSIVVSSKVMGVIFTGGTSRLQVSMQNEIVLIINEGKESYPIIICSCIFLENDISDRQEEGVIDKNNPLKKRPLQLCEVVLRDHPQYIYLIPTPEGILINKVGSGGAVITDTICNSTQDFRRSLVKGVLKCMRNMDCMHYLRNISFRGI